MTIKKGKIVITSILCSLLLIFSVSFIPFNNEEYVYADTTREVEKFTQLQSGIEYKIGERKYFIEKYVNNDELEYVLVALGNHCAIWVQYELWVNSFINNEYDSIQVYVDRIYETMSARIFNHEHSWGDVDNDGRINILLTDLSAGNIKGYYESKNLRLDEESNSLDILFIDLSKEHGFIDLKINEGKAFRATVAHEFQHMLNDIACNGTTNELWLNESLSALSSYLFSSDSHYIDTSYFQYFLSDYGTDEGFLFKKIGVNRGKEYLMTTLFGIFLYKNYGENVLKEIYNEYEKNIVGQAAVENILNGKFTDFKSLFLSFILTTVCDVCLNDNASLLYSEPIVYNDHSYNNIYELKLDNEALFSPIKNLESVKNTGSKWSEKLIYYDKEFFDKAGDVKITSNVDYVFYSVDQQPLKLQQTNEFNMHNSSNAVVLLINCENNELFYQINLYKDNYIIRTVFISIGAVILGGSAILCVVLILRSNRNRENETKD